MSLCTVQVTGTPLGPCGTYPNCSYTGGGHGTTAICCSSVYSGCSGTNTTNCGTYPSCTSSPCCGAGVFTGCTGSITYNCQVGDCPTTCCEQYEADCTGPPDESTYSCSGLSQAQCQADPARKCCRWTTTCVPRPCGGTAPYKVIPPDCAFCGCSSVYGCQKKTGGCASLGESACATCGCTPQGNCPTVACSSLSEANCPSCTGCSKQGTCSPKTCAEVAAINNNPDCCSGCNTCAGTWIIDDVRGALPWTVNLNALDLQGIGSVGVTSVNKINLGSY